MNIPPSNLTAEGIIRTILLWNYPLKSPAYNAIKYCNQLLTAEATVTNLSDPRGRYVLSYTIDGLSKTLIIHWDEDNFKYLPAQQQAFVSD